MVLGTYITSTDILQVFYIQINNLQQPLRLLMNDFQELTKGTLVETYSCNLVDMEITFTLGYEESPLETF